VDSAVAGEGRYDSPLDTEGDVFDSGASVGLGDLKRCGRGWFFTNNTCYNCTEHACYLAGTDVVISNNNFYTDRPDLCNSDAVKIRSRNATVGNNIISGHPAGITGAAPTYSCTITGNVIRSVGTSGGGAIEINSENLELFLSNRAWLASGSVMRDITVSDNIIEFPEEASSPDTAIAVRLYSNYGSGAVQLDGIAIHGNSFRNFRHGIDVYSYRFRRLSIQNNLFIGKPFTEAGFSTGTLMESKSALRVVDAYPDAFEFTVFNGNTVHGIVTLFSTMTESGANVHIPWGIQNNSLSYIKSFKSSDMRLPAVYNAMIGNVGLYFLDRAGWLGNTILQNGLGDGSSSGSYLNRCLLYDGSDLRFYTDDAGTYITLGS
jgi:hypothetical protein